MVRVVHHLTDVSTALAELHRIISPTGTAVVEHASKLHLKAMLRWILRRQDWSPFDHTPLEFVDLNFDFHPAWMHQQFERAGFQIKNIRTVSHYRLDILKRLLPVNWLIILDSWLQPTGNWWQLTPSIFLQAEPTKPRTPSPTGLFRCPECSSPEFRREKHPPEFAVDYLLTCQRCQQRWTFKDGIYDFKTPLNS